MSNNITYREDFGCYWPNYDHNPEACYKKVMTHIQDMDLPISLCKEHNLVIQAGGHAGLWAKRLASKFQHVYTFEPDPILFECIMKNVIEDNVLSVPFALGSEFKNMFYLQNPSAGSGQIVDYDTGVPVCVNTIDNYVSNFKEKVSLILLDVEGFELEILKGARKTIKQYKPVIMLESWKEKKQLQMDYMESINYKFYSRSGRDLVFIHND